MIRIWPLHRFGQSSASRVFVTALVAVVVAATGLGPVHSDPSLVRLLVPLMTGDEFGQVLPLVAGAQLVERQGVTYVLVGRFRDARDAYRSGLRLQKRLKLRFVIDYPFGHPQADGAWIKEVRPQTTARSRPVSAMSERAALLGGEIRLAERQPEALHPSVRGLSPAAAAQSQQPVAQVPQAQAPRQVAVAPVPIRATRLFAVAANPDLNYLFARLNSPEQLQDLRRRVPVAEVVEDQGLMLAQVGVFTPSRTGRRLLRQRQLLLASNGYRWSVVGPQRTQPARAM